MLWISKNHVALEEIACGKLFHVSSMLSIVTIKRAKRIPRTRLRARVTQSTF